jgi:serine/threonine protein kinase
VSLTVGDRLAHYDVTAKIGEGGMGEVYRALDTKSDWERAVQSASMGIFPLVTFVTQEPRGGSIMRS